MTPSELITFHRETFERLNEVLAKKNADYTGGDDALKNFLMVEQFGAASVSQGFFTRMTDKLARMASFVKKGVFEVSDESVDDTLGDIANYAVLWMAYLHSKRAEPKVGLTLDIPVEYNQNPITNDEAYAAPEGIRYAEDYVAGPLDLTGLLYEYKVQWKGESVAPEDIPEFANFLAKNGAVTDWLERRKTRASLNTPIEPKDIIVFAFIWWDDDGRWSKLCEKWREQCAKEGW